MVEERNRNSGYALGSYPCNKEKGETLVELWGMEL